MLSSGGHTTHRRTLFLIFFLMVLWVKSRAPYTQSTFQPVSYSLRRLVVHACSLNTQETKTENIECKGSLCYMVR